MTAERISQQNTTNINKILMLFLLLFVCCPFETFNTCQECFLEHRYEIATIGKIHGQECDTFGLIIFRKPEVSLAGDIFQSAALSNRHAQPYFYFSALTPAFNFAIFR